MTEFALRLISVWNVCMCICPSMFGGQPIHSLTDIKKKKKVCVWGVQTKKKLLSFTISSSIFLPSPFFLSFLHFTSIHTPIPLFLPPYFRHSAHPALYHHMPQRKYALCSPAPELTQHTLPATGRQDPPLSPLSQEKIAKRERERKRKERKKEKREQE